MNCTFAAVLAQQFNNPGTVCVNKLKMRECGRAATSRTACTNYSLYPHTLHRQRVGN
jgi:hypothetical protein